MAIGSILLAILSFACAGLGFLTTPIPGLGAAFSFAAPLLAIGGSIMGGVAMSRAKRESRPADVARTGVILSAIAFVPALFIALFCGVCNALCATGNVHMQKNVSFGVDPRQQNDSANAGARALPPPPFAGAQAQPNDTSRTAGAPAPGSPAADDTAKPATPTVPTRPPAFPPPPLPAGPGGKPRSP